MTEETSRQIGWARGCGVNLYQMAIYGAEAFGLEAEGREDECEKK